MNNNEIIKYKEGFIFKIKKLLKRILNKQEEQYNNIKKDNKENSEERKDKFIDDIKFDKKTIDSVVEKKNFLKEINENEESLNMLSIERLKRLEKYYDGVIEENNKKILSLKNTV